MVSTYLVAALLGAGLAEILKTMSTYVSQRVQLPTVVLGVVVGGVAVCIVQFTWTTFTHGQVNPGAYVLAFGILVLFVAQRFSTSR